MRKVFDFLISSGLGLVCLGIASSLTLFTVFWLFISFQLIPSISATLLRDALSPIYALTPFMEFLPFYSLAVAVFLFYLGNALIKRKPWAIPAFGVLVIAFALTLFMFGVSLQTLYTRLKELSFNSTNVGEIIRWVITIFEGGAALIRLDTLTIAGAMLIFFLISVGFFFVFYHHSTEQNKNISKFQERLCADTGDLKSPDCPRQSYALVQLKFLETINQANNLANIEVLLDPGFLEKDVGTHIRVPGRALAHLHPDLATIAPQHIQLQFNPEQRQVWLHNYGTGVTRHNEISLSAGEIVPLREEGDQITLNEAKFEVACQFLD